MLVTLHVILGLLLGAAGGAAHLQITHVRARLTCSGRPSQGLLLLPLAFAGPVTSVLIAARIAPECAWSTIIGILIVRMVWLRNAYSGEATHET